MRVLQRGEIPPYCAVSQELFVSLVALAMGVYVQGVGGGSWRLLLLSMNCPWT
jgi:hypothetical protein